MQLPSISLGRFPLPPNEQAATANTLQFRKGGIKIRPIRLPVRKTESALKEEDDGGKGVREKVKRANALRHWVGRWDSREVTYFLPQDQPRRVEVKKKTSLKDMMKRQPAPPPAPSRTSSSTSSGSSRKQGPVGVAAAIRRNKKPRICLRLVINCRDNPTHRCCQFEEKEEEEQKLENRDPAPAAVEPQVESSSFEPTMSTPVQEQDTVQSHPPTAKPSTHATLTRPAAPTRRNFFARRTTRPRATKPTATTTARVTTTSTTDAPTPSPPPPSRPPTKTSLATTTTTTTTKTTTTTGTTTTPPRLPIEINKVHMETIDPVAGWVSSVEPVPPYDVENKVKTGGQGEEKKAPAPTTPDESDPVSLSNFKSSPVEPLASPSVSVVHQKIPAECFTQTFECKEVEEGEKHMCCAYMK